MPQITRKRLILAALALAAAVWTYSNSLIGVDEPVVTAHRTLQQKVEAAGHRPSFFAFSGRRYWLDNFLLTAFGASPNSRHLHGNAIDIIVLDVKESTGAKEAKGARWTRGCCWTRCGPSRPCWAAWPRR